MMQYSSTISRGRRTRVTCAALALLVAALIPLRAQTDSSDNRPFTGKADLVGLAKRSQNPIGGMPLVPFQSRFGWNAGPDDRFNYQLALQPVWPTAMDEGALLVPQLTVPFIYQSVSLTEVRSGLGDAELQALIARRRASTVSGGIGARVVAPTASSKGTGFGKWSAGPAAALVATPGPWVVGMLATQVWSFAGQSDRSAVSMLTLEPFINYNMPGGWAITSQPIIRANFEARSDDRWLVPIGGGVSKTFGFILQAMTFHAGAYANVVRPQSVSSWELRLDYVLLFPR